LGQVHGPAAVRRFSAFLTAALLVTPIVVFTAIHTFAPVRGRKGFIGHPPVGHPQTAFAFPPVLAVPAILPGPAFSGTAAAVIPADAGQTAADICPVFRRIALKPAGVFFFTHGNLETLQPNGRRCG
jgi:hypothetical protein